MARPRPERRRAAAPLPPRPLERLVSARGLPVLTALFAALALALYAPVQMLTHALEWQIFGARTTGYHVVNVLLHALGAALLALVFADAGLSAAAAAFGALLFLVHPANVEAVAWISQLKSPSCFVLSMCALLARRRRPALAAACFGLALLAKPTAAFALPVAALLDWSQREPLRWRWLALWAALFAAYAGAEFWTHQRSGAAEAMAEPAVRLRTSVAIAARYLWMSATSLGVSTFHEPAPSSGWGDPLWLAGFSAIAALGARLVVALWRRSPEAAFWAWAAVSFLPVSQIFPFLYPMADRYLYFILPGLIGGALFALRGTAERLGARLAPMQRRRAAVVAALGLAALFAARSASRAAIWASPAAILRDSAEHYPDGKTAHLVRARRAAQLGDADTAVANLRAAFAGGFNRYEQLQSDPAFDPIRDDARFRALVRDIAGWWVDHVSAIPNPTQIELRTLAAAQLARGDREAALASLGRALARGGPLDARLREEIEQVRAQSP